MAGERIAVIGAGLMGHGLAQVFAEAGHRVRIQDPQAAVLETVAERVADNLETLGRDPAAAGLIEPVVALRDAAADADLIIEAAPEQLELKQELFAQLEEHAPAEAILATNTSVIPVTSIAERVKSAHRVVGTHFWNPPYLMPLVEVIQAARTAPETIERTMALLEEVGKSPVHVRRDVPGFVGNRLQHALWREAIALVADGVADAATVDRVVTQGFGRRLAVMGPLENMDLIGLDLTVSIHENVLPDLNTLPGPSPYLTDLVEKGDLGMKTGHGLQEWPADAAARARDRLVEHLNKESA